MGVPSEYISVHFLYAFTQSGKNSGAGSEIVLKVSLNFRLHVSASGSVISPFICFSLVLEVRF